MSCPSVVVTGDCETSTKQTGAVTASDLDAVIWQRQGCNLQ